MTGGEGFQSLGNGFRAIESNVFGTQIENQGMHIVSTQIEQLEQIFAQRHRDVALDTS